MEYFCIPITAEHIAGPNVISEQKIKGLTSQNK